MTNPPEPSGNNEAPREKDGAADEVTALARGLAVLRCVAAADAPLSNRELTELTGIPKPTLSRLTGTLVSTGFLARLPDSERFVLTSSVLELSNGFLRNSDIRSRARPFLTQLAERTALSVHLTVRDRLDMVVIDAIRPRTAVLVTRLEVGSRIDMARTAVGRAYLSALHPDARTELTAALRASTGNDWGFVGSRLDAAISETSAQGYGLAIGEWYDGLNAIATAFAGPNGEIYAINCGGAAQQCPREWLVAHVVPLMRECVARVVEEIGGAQRLPIGS
ncbi:IclR family transcriptional regulator [Paraburkholderia unamae]|uniref:IclR family transcriptional regulator n=1 Tax=Paraburkholderia unamae TaxID=219649 RepID=A0ABX5KC76_9BURK|nr:IclR family transcriptional regulator [Paraburkholderia unamae]PVX73543.1 IclR family transcriptional regulator [Paraburkholderia unamae]CAG9246374.1 IclR family transcriptional regulator [Paraburkholderia unamae]